jgi:hypothetical protein
MILRWESRMRGGFLVVVWKRPIVLAERRLHRRQHQAQSTTDSFAISPQSSDSSGYWTLQLSRQACFLCSITVRELGLEFKDTEGETKSSYTRFLRL